MRAILQVMIGLSLALAMALAAAELPQVPALQRRQPLGESRIEVDAGQEWTTAADPIALAEGEAPVLALRAFAQAGSGGCNVVLQILVDGVPLSESPFRRRLLNKLPGIEPPGTEYHFAWYQPTQRAWMTIFGQAEPVTWAGSGRDTEFLFDLGGLIQPGRPPRISFRHVMPSLPAAIHRERAPLVILDAALGVFSLADATRLRQVVEGSLDLRPVPPGAPPPAVAAAPAEAPYEVVWSGRPESPRAQVAFEDLDAWTVLASGDMAVTLSVSPRRIWRQRSACLSYTGGTRTTTVFLRPKVPVPVAGPVDAANLWLFPEIERMKEPHPQGVATLEDSAGREVAIDLGRICNSYWVLQHGVLSPADLAAVAGGDLRFTGLAISLDPVKEGERRLHLESLAFYKQDRKPFTEDTRRERPGLPLGDDGMLPPPPAGATVRVEKAGSGALFTSETPAGVLRYRVSPGSGVFAGIEAQWNDGPWFQPMAGGDIALDLPPGTAPARLQVVSSVVEAGSLQVRWRRSVEGRAEYRLRGRTLAVDVAEGAGKVTGLSFGRLQGLPEARGIEVPYLKYGWGYGPQIACGGGVFVSVLADWYHGGNSRIDGSAGPAPGGGLVLMKGTEYLPLTDGRRNALCDRVLMTVSPEVADVLPSIPHPPSPHRERLSPYLFFMASTMQPELWRTLKRHGIDHVMTCDFAGFYVQDYAEGFAGRWRPHPSLTLDQIREYRRGIRDLGYLFGAYSDLRDGFPLNEFWDENCVSLDSDGDLVDGWYGNFGCKPNYLPVLARRVGEKVQAEYPPDTVYMDTHSCAGANACDFEAGVPGAGMARDQVLYNAECMLETRRWYGSVVSEGAVRWMYAGIADVDYASLFMAAPAHQVPPFVDFDLLRIHPLNLGTMMGYAPDVFLGTDKEALAALYQDPGTLPAPEAFYQYVATSLAYGHMLMLGYGYIPRLSRMIHLYALMQGLQCEYLPDAVSAIHYHNGTDYVTASQALQEDSLRRGRLRIRYRGGLALWVNLSATETWRLDTAELPPFGWWAAKADTLLAFSALREGQRADYVRGPAYTYLAAGERRARVEAVEVHGAVWLKRDGNGLRLVPCGDLGPWESFPAEGLPEFQKDLRLRAVPPQRGIQALALDTRALLGCSAAAVRIVGRDLSGREHPATVVRGQLLEVQPTAEATDYLLRP